VSRSAGSTQLNERDVGIPERRCVAHSTHYAVVDQPRERKAARKESGTLPEQIDVHGGLPVVQALKRVALYGNAGIVEQHSDLKTE
jgi:hypothetical protein